MFESDLTKRFTDRANRVLALANQTAQQWNHEYIGTEHILIGVLKEDHGVGAHILKDFGIDMAKLTQTVEDMVTKGPDLTIMGKLPQTPWVKKALEYAIENARALDHNYVGTEHILLGLLDSDVENTIAKAVLLSFGMTKEIALKNLKDLLGIVDEVEEEEKSSCLICDKYEICMFAQNFDSNQLVLMALFGDLADDVLKTVLTFCGGKCKKFGKVEK